MNFKRAIDSPINVIHNKYGDYIDFYIYSGNCYNQAHFGR